MKEIPVTRGQVTIVDDGDFEFVSRVRWYAVAVQRRDRTNYYVCRHDNGKKIWLHRVLLGAQPGVFIDHKNRNGLDNRRENLRLCTSQMNARNRIKIWTPESRSRFKGVVGPHRRGGWDAYITITGRSVRVGTYSTEEEAARAYDQKVRDVYGEFARVNFPTEPGDLPGLLWEYATESLAMSSSAPLA